VPLISWMGDNVLAKDAKLPKRKNQQEKVLLTVRRCSWMRAV